MKTQGRIAYEVFNKSIGTTTIYPFGKLSLQIKQAWEDAAKAVYELKDGDSESCTSSTE